jgi:hypothetical protein
MKHNHCRPFERQENDNIVSITVPCVDIKELRRQQYKLLLITNPSEEHVGLINLLDYMLDATEVWDK